MTDTVVAPDDQLQGPTAMEARLHTMHVTLLFIAVLLCVLVALNVVVIAAD
jgi:hypothetical protein